MKNKIIVPADFTKAANKAIRQAISIAKKAGSAVTLLHVIEDNSASAEEVKEKLSTEAESIRQNEGIACEVLIKEGNLFEIIPLTLSEKNYDLMVIGTHCISDSRQKLFGADILKLVAKAPIPVLVMQEDSPVIESFHKIVLPVDDNDNFQQAVEAVLLFAAIYDVEAHLYSIHKPGFSLTMQMLTNIEETTRKFEEKGVRLIRIKEEQDDFSRGYTGQTLRYAHTLGTETIWMMSFASQEYYYMAKAYKEAMLLNEFHLPVLCAGGRG